MKKISLLLAVMLFAAAMLAGCGNQNAGQKSDRISVVTTIFPEYDWVKEITKGNEQIELTLLLDKGVDLHSFQPTAEDIVKLSSCDLFIYVGGESDAWVEDALSGAVNQDMVVLNLMDILQDTVKEEELVEGMESEALEEGEEEETEYDEHVWLSLKNAEIICQTIAGRLTELDASHKALYEENAKNYIDSLRTLHQEYETAVSKAEHHTLLFGDRFPFRYLVDDYGLSYYAAFAGCSAESEASFETITFLADKAEELGLSVILQIEGTNGKIAETIKETTAGRNQQILTMDSMQAVTEQDIAAGETYLSIMRKNLEVLKQALQ